MADYVLGKRLRLARDLGKLSQRELARRAGLGSERHVGLIEEGERPNVTTDTAEKLCRALGLSLDWLLRGEGEAPTEASVSEAMSRHPDPKAPPASTRTTPDDGEQGAA